ncbi:MAG: response regulator [Spirochaetales bacterium]|nr:response regulator [Spirochaetales bacterium]
MLKAVIIDDEYYFRQSLKKKLPWQQLGIEISGEANNGEDALDLIRSSLPDLALIDINMPVIDGIELVSRIRSEGIDTFIILITGYDEFKYAQKAIGLGVTNYLLKPVVQAELLSAVTSITERIKLESQENNYIEKLLVARKINDILLGQLHEYKLLKFPHKSTIQVVSMSIQSTHDLFDFDELSVILEEIINEIFIYKFIIDSNGNYILLIGQNGNPIKNDYLIHCLALFLKKIIKRFTCKTYVGIGNKYTNMSDISRSYRESMIALKDAILHDSDSIVLYENTIGQSLSQNYFDKNKKRELFGEVRLKNIQKIQEYVDSLFFELLEKNASEEIYKAYSYDLILSAIEFCESEEVLKGNVENLNDLFIRIGESVKVKEIKKILENSLIEISNQYPKIRSQKKSNLIYRMKTFILQNVFDVDFSINKISEYLGLNYHYTCTLFKKETGETLNEYISILRMEKALSLLKNTNKSISTISYICGYKDQYYFSRIFKKHFHKPPSQMR